MSESKVAQLQKLVGEAKADIFDHRRYDMEVEMLWQTVGYLGAIIQTEHGKRAELANQVIDQMLKIADERKQRAV